MHESAMTIQQCSVQHIPCATLQQLGIIRDDALLSTNVSELNAALGETRHTKNACLHSGRNGRLRRTGAALHGFRSTWQRSVLVQGLLQIYWWPANAARLLLQVIQADKHSMTYAAVGWAMLQSAA